MSLARMVRTSATGPCSGRSARSPAPRRGPAAGAGTPGERDRPEPRAWPVGGPAVKRDPQHRDVIVGDPVDLGQPGEGGGGDVAGGRELADGDKAAVALPHATLRVFLQADRSWRDAAAELHIHRQTLGYRLRKIEQLTTRGINRPDHIAQWWLALRARDLLAGQPGDR